MGKTKKREIFFPYDETYSLAPIARRLSFSCRKTYCLSFFGFLC